MADDQGEVGHRQLVEVGDGLAHRVVHVPAVPLERQTPDRLELTPSLEGLDELGHEGLAAFAAGHEVGVRESLVRRERHVRAPDHAGNAPRAQPLGQVVAGGRRRGGRRDAHEIGGEDVGPIDRRHVRAVDAHFVTGALEGRADHRQAEPRVAQRRPHVEARRLGFDETDLHGQPLSWPQRRRRDRLACRRGRHVSAMLPAGAGHCVVFPRPCARPADVNAVGAGRSRAS